MAIDTILILASILIGCACGGLFLVRLSNPRLLGLGWLAGSFAAGGLGAMLLLLTGRIPAVLSIVVADMLILAAFFLLQVAVAELIEAPLQSSFGFGLLAIQLVVDLLRIVGLAGGRVRLAVVGLLLAAQTAQTVRLLFKQARGALRVPGFFCAILLLLISLANLLRSVTLLLGLLDRPGAFARVEAGIYMLILAVALGIAFGFFWMTTTMLTEHVERMASTDPLTRIYNRRMFLTWCEKEWDRAQRNEASFSILMLDLDHFKQVNDRFGHHTGDQVLCTLVEQMQNAIRGIDVLGRWGGEEFTVLLPTANREAAFLVAQRIRGNVERTWIAVPLPRPANTPSARHLHEHPIHERLVQERQSHDHPPVNEPRFRVTVSVGVATYQGPADSVDSMLRRADAALYNAKTFGRNQVFLDLPMLEDSADLSGEGGATPCAMGSGS